MKTGKQLASLRIWVFWDVISYHLANSHSAFQPLGSIHWFIWSNILDDLNPRWHHFENLKPCKWLSLFSFCILISFNDLWLVYGIITAISAIYPAKSFSPLKTFETKLECKISRQKFCRNFSPPQACYMPCYFITHSFQSPFQFYEICRLLE